MRLDLLPRRLSVLTACLLIGSSAFGTTPPQMSASSSGATRMRAIAPPIDALVVPPAQPIAAANLPPTPTGTLAPTPAPGRSVDPTPTPRAKPARTSRPAATPRPTPKRTISSSQKIVHFGTSGTQAQFLALMKNMSVDVIEMQSGTYRGWHLWFDINRTARPLTIRPAGGTVIFDGAGSSSHQGLFYPGWYHYTSHITFQGPFTVENYALGDTGLVSTAWVDHVAFNGFHTSGITGLAGGQLSWTVYVSSDGAHSGSNITFNDWTVGPSKNRNVGGLTTYHNPNAHGVTALRWKISGASSAMALWGTARGIDVERWTITGCNYAVSTDGVASGVLKNNTSTGSTNRPILKKPMVNGAGNSWH